MSPSATCANEKIASFEPSVGTISRRRVDRDAEAPVDPAAIASRSSGSPVARGYDETALDRREQRLADERRRHLARVADAEVDQLDPARARLGLPVVEARERVLRELGEHGGEAACLDGTQRGTAAAPSYVRASSVISTRSSTACA